MLSWEGPEPRTHRVVYEHPEFGVSYVTFEWRKLATGRYALLPVAVEFDFWVPQEEQEVLAGLLGLGARLEERLQPPTS